jgi:hypothetical protein
MERETNNQVDEVFKSTELKKHVAIIHSSNKLTLLQRKIANALLFNAYPRLQEQDEHTIHIAKLCQIIGYDSNDHKTIKKALVNLLSTVLEWNLVDGERLDSEGIWNASSMIADASIDGAICTYSYSNKMRKLLYRPHIYGRLDMLVQAKFQSNYGLALYENCNRFQDIGQTPWFALSQFRKLMGVEENKYKVFRDFKSRVLDKAIEEVNKFSSLIVSPQLRKEKRQVVSIQFLIKRQNAIGVTVSDSPEEIPASNLTAHLTKKLKTTYGLSSLQIRNVFAKYDAIYVDEKTKLIESSISYQKGRIKNLNRYLLSALRDDYQKNKINVLTSPQAIALSREKSQRTGQRKGERSNQRKEQQQTPAMQEAMVDAIKLTEFRRFQDKHLLILFNELPQPKQTSILKQFEKSLSGIYQDVYFRNGLENVLVQDRLCDFLRRHQADLTASLVSYQTWLKKIDS